MSAASATDDLATIEARVWAELTHAADTRGHGWRTPVLATVGGSAGCDARVVVLREVQADQRELVFYTDARSPKAAQIEANPAAVMVMWSAELGWQLRVAVTL